MRWNKLIILVLFWFVYPGCSHQAENGQQIIKVDIEAAYAKTPSIADMFSKVELIKLDSSHPISNTVYTGGAYISCSENYIYLLDERTFKIHIFDKSGRDVLVDDKVGRGPGEFTMAYQITYDPLSDLVEVLNPLGRILRYTSDSLKHIETLKYKGLLATHSFYKNKDGYLLYSHSEQDQLWSMKPSNTEVQSFGYHTEEYLAHYLMPQHPFFNIGDRTCFFRNYDGLIYTFDVPNHKLVPYISWDFGKYQCELKDIPVYKSAREYRPFINEYSKNRLSPFIDMSSYGNILLVNVVFKGKTHTLFYDLKSGRCFFFEKTEEDMKLLCGFFNGDVMYKYVDGHHLSEYVNRGILDNDSQNIYDDIISNDGYAVIKYYL